MPPPLCAVSLAVLAAAAPCSPQEGPSCRVTRLAGPGRIRIDGRLDEDAWRGAALLGPLTQVEPVEGAEPSRRTEVRLCYDADFLYLGIRCFDDPTVIRARIMTRDARLDPDDRVEFWVDTFHDQRFAFWFQIGAAGSRGDALIAGNGDRFNKSWDGIWYGRSRITGEGWQAEVGLPFKTVAFRAGSRVWGFNFVRRRKATNEEMRWASPLVAYRFFRVSRGGTLRGLEGMDQGLGLDVVPYVKGRRSRDRQGRDGAVLAAEVGGDLSYRLTPQLRLVLTYNTDFAETEVDERQVNLTRFPLFFPEKRAFFLADAGLFEFGLPAGRRGGGRTPIAFFSRRIGLGSAGNEIPIRAGAKLVGRIDDWNVGALGTVMDQTGDEAGRGLGVVRVSRNLAAESSVGVIATAGRPTGDGHAWTGGVDFKYGDSEAFGPGKSFNAWGYLLGTATDGDGGDGTAWGGRAELRTSEWFHRGQALVTGTEFDPKLGFVQRPGQREYSWTSAYTYRGDGEPIQRVRIRLSPRFRTFTGGRTESWEAEVGWLDLELGSGDRVRLSSRREFVRLPDPFEIRTGIVVPAGGFRTTTHTVEADTSDKRPVAAGGTVEYGGLYNGRLTRIRLRSSVRPNAWVQAGADYQLFRVSLDQGSFTTRLYEGRLDLSLDPDVSLRNLVQYDSDSKNLTVQSRFRWTIEPGRDLFLLGIYGWEKARHGAPFLPTTQDLTLKLAFTFRF